MNTPSSHPGSSPSRLPMLVLLAVLAIAGVQSGCRSLARGIIGRPDYRFERAENVANEVDHQGKLNDIAFDAEIKKLSREVERLDDGLDVPEDEEDRVHRGTKSSSARAREILEEIKAGRRGAARPGTPPSLPPGVR